jgi:hypothetical protein
MGGGGAVHLALDHVENDIHLLLGMHFTDAQMLGLIGQRYRIVAAEKHSSAKDLRADFKAMHHACGNVDRVVRRIATGNARHGDAALTFGDPQKARLAQRAHRLHTPTASRSKPRQSDESRL